MTQHDHDTNEHDTAQEAVAEDVRHGYFRLIFALFVLALHLVHVRSDIWRTLEEDESFASAIHIVAIQVQVARAFWAEGQRQKLQSGRHQAKTEQDGPQGFASQDEW